MMFYIKNAKHILLTDKKESQKKEEKEMKDVVKTILLMTAVMILLRWADGTSTQMARKSTSRCDGIMSIFWTEDDQTKLEKYN